MATNNPINNTLVERSVTIVTSSLGANGVETGYVTIGRTFTVKRIISSHYSEIRLYGTAAARDADASREFGDLSFIGSQSKYICGVKLTSGTGLSWHMSPPAKGQNCDTPTASRIYYSIRNDTLSATPITVEIKYLIEEV